MVRKFSMALRFAMVLLLIVVTILPGKAASDPAVVVVRGTELRSSPGSYRIGNVTYVPLRAFSVALDENAKLQWDGKTSTCRVHFDKLELQVTEGQSYIEANGRYIYLYGKVINWHGSLMLPIRPLAKALGVTVDWDPVTETVSVSGEIQPLENGETYYEEETLYWLSHIVYSEAGLEPLEGQIAVANVVLNRVQHEYWPDTVYDVVFDDRCGTQFTPAAIGSIYWEPSESAIIAAKLALDGANVVGDSYFFLNPDAATNHWIEESCEFVTTIGHHSFYTMSD